VSVRLRTAALAVAVGVLEHAATASGQVTGLVMDKGLVPIAGARVSVQATGPSTLTDANGAFALPTASGSGLVVVAARKGYFNAAATVTTPETHLVLALEAVPGDDDPSYRLQPPDACGGCHPDQYAQWLGSPMSRAGVNTWVHDVYDGSATPGGMGGFVYLRDSALAAANPASECSSCHQPETWIDAPHTAMLPHDTDIPGVVHGVSCDVCHKIADIDETRINAPGIYPGVVTFTRPAGPAHEQVQYGVLGDVDYALPGAMRASYQPQLVAEVCGACHQDKNDPDLDGDFDEPNGVLSEPTYLEWAASPYGDLASPRYASCADCHMAPAAAARVCSVLDLGRNPATIRSHRIEGTTPEYLENAADMTIHAGRAGDAVEVEVAITNSRTGHHLPTGVTIRNVILLVEARRVDDGLALASVGSQTIHALGGVGDPAAGYWAGLPGKLFAFVNHDAAGTGPTFFTEAAGVLFDSRIPALATDTTHYRFALPPDGGAIIVRARLVYRRSFRALVDAKGWTTDGHGRPLADVTAPDYGHLMEEAERTVLAPSCAGAPAGAACADGNACNGEERCDDAGRCVTGPPLACDDGDPCSDDSCDPDLGCVPTANAASCDDGNPCTASDRCAAGACAGIPACDDGNLCTDDLCAAAGCVHVPNVVACDDGNACTTGDRCAAGACVATGTVGCDDGDLCTADACVPEAGCVHAAAPRVTCVAAEEAKIRLRNRDRDAGDQLVWSWRTTAPLAPSALGDPAGSTGYALCLFDRVGGIPARAAALAVSPGERWRTRPNGWAYRDPHGTVDGLRTVFLQAGPNGGKLALVAKGVGLPLPIPRYPYRLFAQDPALVVQLVRDDGTCWESTFGPATNRWHVATRFEARLP